MWEIIIIICLILLNGVFSMSEMALVAARKSKLLSDAETGDNKAKTAYNLAIDPDKFLSSVQVGISVVIILTGLFSDNDIAEILKKYLITIGLKQVWAAMIAKSVVVVIIMYFSVLFGELVPKRIALANAENVAKKVAKPMKFFAKMAKPLVFLLSKSSNLITNILGIKFVDSKITEEEIKSMIQECTDKGEVSVVEQDIVERVFTLGDLSISSIMTLRDDIVWLEKDMTEEEIIKKVEENIYELYPVCDGDLDHVIGIVTLKDYVLSIRRQGDFSLEKMLKKPTYVHENMSVYSVLEVMKKNKINRALVFDEFGGLCGIISIKDILDALVGNSNLDPQKDPDIIERGDKDGWIVNGQCPIYDFLSYFNLDETIEDYDFSTVGGLVLEELQHVPEVGEKIEWNNFSFEVVDMDGARIDKIIAKKLAKIEEPAPDSNPEA